MQPASDSVVRLIDNNGQNIVHEVRDIDVTSLADVVDRLISNDDWQSAKVEIIKPAPRKKTLPMVA